jgi:transcriptional regulator with XRE-family HTH domain
MKDRLKLLLEHLRIPASEFADNMGVQRSSISHLLSGRNNPGYDFIQKVLITYPQINPDWLILGQGKITREPAVLANKAIQADKTTEDPVEAGMPGVAEKKEVASQVINSETTSIQKVIVLYKDGTFEEYTSRKS